MLIQFGIDYGLRPKFGIIGDISFQENYDKAKCKGLVYVHCPDSTGKEMPCEFGFMMQEERYAEKFLDSLIAWKEKLDDSRAIDLEFFEYKNGDYLLSISPNIKLLIESIIPDHLRDHVDPAVVQMYQGKGGMKISQNYRNFKENYLKGRNIAVRYFLVNEHNQIIKRSEKYFVKTEFKFSIENNLDDESKLNPILNRNIKRSKPPKIKKDDREFIDNRNKKLKYFFPVTYQRLRNEGWLSEVVSEINKRYSMDQIIQAVSNLIFMERLKQNDTIKIDTARSGYDLELIKYLSENYESFNSYFPDSSIFNKQKIEKQIRLDEQYFKKQTNNI